MDWELGEEQRPARSRIPQILFLWHATPQISHLKGKYNVSVCVWTYIYIYIHTVYVCAYVYNIYVSI